jgi:CHAD domain-containing protein
MYGGMLFDYVRLKEIKPVLYGYVREALSMLDSSVMPGENVVHDVRVLMKKSRATIRLIRSQSDEGFFSREYHSFRETGRIMRAWRETSVYRKLLKELRKKYPWIFKELIDNEKITRLLSKPDPVSGPSPQMKEDIDRIIDVLNKSGHRIRFQTMSNLDPRLLLRELEVTYDIVTDCYLIARNKQTTSNLHELRKKSKDFLYQLYFFRPLKPQAVKRLEVKLDNITRDLGRYNDLAGLIKALDYKYSGQLKSPVMDELIILIRNEQDKYLFRIWPAAYKIFCPGQNLINLPGFKISM